MRNCETADRGNPLIPEPVPVGTMDGFALPRLQLRKGEGFCARTFDFAFWTQKKRTEQPSLIFCFLTGQLQDIAQLARRFLRIDLFQRGQFVRQTIQRLFIDLAFAVRLI